MATNYIAHLPKNPRSIDFLYLQQVSFDYSKGRFKVSKLSFCIAAVLANLES